MHSKQQENGRVSALGKAIDTHVISDHSVRLRPGEQRSVLLGEFRLADPPKGFAVELSPDPFPAESVETQITTVGYVKHCKYVLFIANYGTRAITAEVRQL